MPYNFAELQHKNECHVIYALKLMVKSVLENIANCSDQLKWLCLQNGWLEEILIATSPQRRENAWFSVAVKNEKAA